MSGNSNDNDFYGSLAAAAGDDDSDSDAKAIQDMDDLEDDLFGSLLKKNRRGSGSPKMKAKLPALDTNDLLAEKPARPRAGRRKASLIDDDDDLLDGLLPSDNETSPPPKTVQTKKPPLETASTVSFGSYVPSVSSTVAKPARQSALPEPEYLSFPNGSSRRDQPRLHEEQQLVQKPDSRTSGAQEVSNLFKEKMSDNDGLDRVPQRERRSSLKDSSELQANASREPRNGTQDLDWLTTGVDDRREGSGRRGIPSELPWLDANPSKANASIPKREREVPRSDQALRSDGRSLRSDVVPRIETTDGVVSRSSTARDQSLGDRQSMSAADVGLRSLPDQLHQNVSQQDHHHGGTVIPREIKILEETVTKFATSLEGKMSKIEDECHRIQQLLVQVNEAHAEQRKTLSEASRLESERFQNAGWDLETRLTKIHLDWKKDLVSQEDDWMQKWTGSCRQLQSTQLEWRNQAEGLQARVREEVTLIQTELNSFLGKLKPLQVNNENQSERKPDGVVNELTKLNDKLDRLVSQFEADRQLMLAFQRPSQDQTPALYHPSLEPQQLVQKEQAQIREDMVVQKIMEKINDLQEKAASQIAERIQHLEKAQESLSSSVGHLVSDVHNSFTSTSNMHQGLASMQALKANEEELLKWHSQLEEESQSIALERSELAKQKQELHRWTSEIEERLREVEENEASGKKAREVGLEALEQAKQLDTNWKERMASLNGQLEALQRKELYLLQSKRADKLDRQAGGRREVESCRRCQGMVEVSPPKVDEPRYWNTEPDSVLVDQLSDIHPVGINADTSYSFQQSLSHRNDSFDDSKVLMWSLLAVQDRKLLQEEQSYLASLSLSRTMSEF